MGGRSPQNPKKKPKFGGNTHVTLTPYLSNGDRLREFYCTIGFKTLKNGGVGQLKTPKKKPNFGGNTYVTLKP